MLGNVPFLWIFFSSFRCVAVSTVDKLQLYHLYAYSMLVRAYSTKVTSVCNVGGLWSNSAAKTGNRHSSICVLATCIRGMEECGVLHFGDSHVALSQRMLIFLFSPLSMPAERVICFACHNLDRSANLPEGLYILPMFFQYFLYFFFNGRLSSHRSSDTNGTIFTKISGLVDRCKFLLTSLSFFFWFFKGRCHGNESKSKNLRFPGPIYFVAMPFGNGMG